METPRDFLAFHTCPRQKGFWPRWLILFDILQKIIDNAYVIDLLEIMRVSTTFNVIDLYEYFLEYNWRPRDELFWKREIDADKTLYQGEQKTCRPEDQRLFRKKII